MKRLTLAVCLAFIAAAGINASVATADVDVADETISCEVSVKTGKGTVDLQFHDSSDSSSAIPVDPNVPIAFSISINEPATHRVWVEIAGRKIDIPVPTPGSEATSWKNDNFLLADYGTIGTGLYLVGWSATTGDRELCEARGLFEIEGSVFSDPIGIVATATLLLGGVGLVLTVGKDATATLALTIRVTIGGKVKKGDEPGWYQWLKPRADWSFSLTLLSTLIGLLFGIGSAVFLQQAAIAPLSFEIALQVVLPSVLLPPALSSLKILDHMIHQR